MKRKRFLALLGSIFLTLVLATLLLPACAAEEPAPAPTPTPTPAPPAEKLPDFIGVTTSGVGSAGMSMAVGWTPVMEKSLGVPVRILPAWSQLVNLTQIRIGKAHFVGGGASQGAAGPADMGTDLYASHEWGPQRVGAFWYNYHCPYGILVRGDSDIQTLADLKGKKLAYYIGSPAWWSGMEGCLAFAGITTDDVEMLETGGYDTCARAVAEGRADFTYNAPISTISFELAEIPQGTRYIDMPLEDKEGWAAYHALNPFYSHGPCELGVEVARGVVMANHPFVIWTYEDVDEYLIYRLCKFFDEGYNDYKDTHKRCLDMSLESWLSHKDMGIAVPIHPGGVRYLKEIGEWDAADEQWNSEQWAKVDKYEKAWADALAEALPQKIVPRHDSEAWLKIWDKHRGKVEPFSMREK